MHLRAVQHEPFQLCDVVLGDLDLQRELLSYVHRHADLVYGYPWVRRDDGTCREVNALAGQVSAESSFLLAQPLHERLQCPS